MPEGLEAEIWRRSCEPLVGRTITSVAVDDRVCPPGFEALITGATIDGVRRVGKVVLIDTDRAIIGLHFGMTGRLIVDGEAAIERLAYASGRDAAEWDRLAISTSPLARRGVRPAPALRFNDPRRLGHVSLDADLSHLGVDFQEVTTVRLARALGARRLAIKPALLDQRIVAGLGNLCADEVLWWAGIDPHRLVGSLDAEEIDRLAGAIRRRLPTMLRRGGSTMGVLGPTVRRDCPPCVRDGAALLRTTIGGRTAVWCPTHQK